MLSSANETPLSRQEIIMDQGKLIAVAAELFRLHGLDVRGWRLEFRNFANRLGCCSSQHKIIAINAYYAENNEEGVVLDTLVHEVAHALVGPVRGHDLVWKAMALKLGCIPSACGKIGIKVQPGKWQASCPSCDYQFHKYRTPKFIRGYYCPKCGKEKGRLAFTAQNGNEVGLHASESLAESISEVDDR
jgi:predicted SprT family Zn-dependent metalloprotease